MGKKETKITNTTITPSATTPSPKMIAQMIIDSRGLWGIGDDDEDNLGKAIGKINDSATFKAVQDQIFAKTKKGLGQYLSSFLDSSDRTYLTQIINQLKSAGVQDTDPTIQILTKLRTGNTSTNDSTIDTSGSSLMSIFMYLSLTEWLAGASVLALIMPKTRKLLGSLIQRFRGKYQNIDANRVINDPEAINLLNGKLGMFQYQQRKIRTFLNNIQKSNVSGQGVMTNEEANKIMKEVLESASFRRHFANTMSDLAWVAFKNGKISKNTAKHWMIPADWPAAEKEKWNKLLDQAEEKFGLRSIMKGGTTTTAAKQGGAKTPNYNYTYTSSTGGAVNVNPTPTKSTKPKSTKPKTTKPKTTKPKTTTSKPKWPYPNVTRKQYKSLGLNQQYKLKANPNFTLDQLKTY